MQKASFIYISWSIRICSPPLISFQLVIPSCSNHVFTASNASHSSLLPLHLHRRSHKRPLPKRSKLLGEKSISYFKLSLDNLPTLSSKDFSPEIFMKSLLTPPLPSGFSHPSSPHPQNTQPSSLTSVAASTSSPIPTSNIQPATPFSTSPAPSPTPLSKNQKRNHILTFATIMISSVLILIRR